MSFLGGSIYNDIYTKVKGYINSDGSIMDGMKDMLLGEASKLNETYGVTIDVSEIEGVEHISLDGYTYTSLTSFETNFETKANSKTITHYFGDYDFYTGVITSSMGSASDFIKALCSASGADLHFSTQTLPDESVEYPVAYAAGFVVRAVPSENGQPAQIYVHDILASDPSLFMPLFMTSESHGNNIVYFMFRGSSGDCYFKGFYTNSSTVPSIEEAEEFFENIPVGGYRITRDASTGTDEFGPAYENVGGMAIIKMVDKTVDGGTTRYDAVLMGEGGVPLITFNVYDAAEIVNRDNAVTEFKNVITMSDAMSMFAAPIYSPLTGNWASQDSFWGLVMPQYGYYYASLSGRNYSYGSRHICDHGLLIQAG